MNVRAPNGKRIVAILDTVQVKSQCVFVSKDEHGTFDLHYAGVNEPIWDTQKEVLRELERVFLDAEGGEWLERQLVIAEAAPEKTPATEPVFDFERLYRAAKTDDEHSVLEQLAIRAGILLHCRKCGFNTHEGEDDICQCGVPLVGQVTP